MEVVHTRWVKGPELMEDNTVLHIRDRYRWLHYMLGKEDNRKLVGFLQGQIDAPALSLRSSKAN
jgi:hypothetical protein